MYRSILSVDGVEVRRAVVAANGGDCEDVEPGNGDAYEFGTPRPCPAAADGEAAFDTRGLSDGVHVVRLAVEDAAGNATVVHEGQFRTHNAPLATVAPMIDGDPRVGGGLAVDDGAWDGEPTTLDHRWLRCDAAGAHCVPIAGAGDPAYAPKPADAYRRLVAEVTAENVAGVTVVRTAPSALIADEDGRTSPDGPRPDPDPDPNPDPGPGGPGPDIDPDPDPRARAPTEDEDDGEQRPGPGGGGDALTTRPPAPPHDAGGLANPLAGAGGHAANGTNASNRARLSVGLRRGAGAGGNGQRRVRVPFGRRATVVGRLFDERDRAISGARVTVAWRLPGRGWVARGTVETDSQGRLAASLRPGPSRMVRVTYFAFADSRRFIASDTVKLDVVSPVTIRASRAQVKSRGLVTLSGRAGAKPKPVGGVLVTLQGWQEGWGWRTFRTVRADRSGRWSTRYRFRSAAGSFAFRAIVPEQGGHPYATGRSRSVRVEVR